MSKKKIPLPVAKCPHCGYEVDRAADIKGSDSQPKQGDFSICLNCAGLLTYDAELKIRALSKQEEAAIPSAVYKQLRTAQQTVVNFMISRIARKSNG